MTQDIATYTTQLCKFLHNGDGWQKIPNTNLFNSVQLFVPSLLRWLGYAEVQQVECFPTTTVQNLDMWSASVGIPGSDYPETLTPAQIKMLTVLRVTDLGGQSPQYFIDYAAKLGYSITIEELSVLRAGFYAGARCADTYGDFSWIVHVANAGYTPLKAGFKAGQPLGVNTDITLLAYEFNRIRPAHTNIFFTAN
jgi:uncharacterized protein YmfQ (DUF2313 family)